MWRIMLWTIMNNMWTLFLYRSTTVLLSKQLATATVISERVVTTKPETLQLDVRPRRDECSYARHSRTARACYYR